MRLKAHTPQEPVDERQLAMDERRAADQLYGRRQIHAVPAVAPVKDERPTVPRPDGALDHLARNAPNESARNDGEDTAA